MKTKPILFNTEMVQAIREDRKTQTRRIAKELQGIKDPQFDGLDSQNEFFTVRGEHENGSFGELCLKKPISVGTILWVRETWSLFGWDFNEGFVNILFKDNTMTRLHPEVEGMDEWIDRRIEKLEKKGMIEQDPEDEEHFRVHGNLWEPSIFMPKWAARIFLEVTNVRVERLQNISAIDAVAEGIEVIENERYGRVFKHYFMGDQEHYFKVPELSFKSLWQSINGKGSWEANPWVWVYDFKRVKKTENFIA